MGFFAHAGNQLGIALGIGVVQGGVHLVEQAKRSGVELKNGKNQRNGSQGLFSAGEQVNGLVFLARRLRNDLHARVQNFVTGNDQARIAATEQLRKHAPEVPVDLFKRARQQFARFRVNFSDGIFQGVHGLGEVGILGVQKLLALAGRLEFVQRCKVDRA